MKIFFKALVIVSNLQNLRVHDTYRKQLNFWLFLMRNPKPNVWKKMLDMYTIFNNSESDIKNLRFIYM